MSPGELKRNYEAWRAGKETWIDDAGTEMNHSEDIFLVYPMAIPLNEDPKCCVYTCKHLKQNGDCGIYENRPRMCINYPYETECTFKDCTMERNVQE